VVVLHEVLGDALLPVAGLVVGLEEEAAPVAVHVRLDHDHAGDLRFEETHGAYSSSRAI
jgi:hypothetical protein